MLEEIIDISDIDYQKYIKDNKLECYYFIICYNYRPDNEFYLDEKSKYLTTTYKLAKKHSRELSKVYDHVSMRHFKGIDKYSESYKHSVPLSDNNPFECL